MNAVTETVAAEAVSGVEIFVPLNKLKKSPRNARKVPHGEAAIEALAAAQACDFHTPLVSSPALENVRARIRAVVPRLEEDRYLHADIAAAELLVRGGDLIAAAEAIHLPAVEGGLP